MPHWGLQRGAGAAASALLCLHSNILSCAKNNARTLSLSVSRLWFLAAGVAPLSDSKEALCGFYALKSFDLGSCGSWLVSLFFTVCCSWFLGHVWTSEINSVSVQDFYPLAVILEKCLSSSFRGKRRKNIQMSNYPCSAVHETVTQLETLFSIFEIHILFTRCEWNAHDFLLFRRAQHRPSSLKQQGWVRGSLGIRWQSMRKSVTVSQHNGPVSWGADHAWRVF